MAIVAASIVGCGARSAARDVPADAPPLGVVVGEGADAAFAVAPSVLARSEYFELVLERLEEAGGASGRAEVAYLRDLARRTERAIVGVWIPDPDTVETTTVLRGRFDASDVAEMTRGEPGVREERHDDASIVVARDRALARVGSHTLVLGDTARVRAAVARALSPRAPETTGDVLDAFAREGPGRDAPLALAIRVTPAVRVLLEELAGEELVLDAVRTILVAARLGPGIELRVLVATDSPGDAAIARDVVELVLSRIAGSALAAVLGLAASLDARVVTIEGSAVVARVSVSDADLRAAIAAAGELAIELERSR